MRRKILLINPYGTSTEVLCPPLNLLYISSYAKAIFPDYEFKLLDFDRLKLSFDKQIQIVLSEEPDIIGLTAMTATYYGGLRLARGIKEKRPDIPIIMGGIHVTAMNGTESPYIDCAVLGEGEIAFSEILGMIEREETLPRIYESRLLENIDFFPAWDLVDLRAYKWFAPFKYSKQAVVYWSRGCPFECVFCSNAVWRFKQPRVRYRTPESIVNELKLLREKYRVREVYVFDDEINTNPEWLNAVCKEIINSGLDIFWKCQMRANKALVSEELLKNMKKAGCWHIAWGLESGDDDVLRGIKKRLNTDEILSSLSIAKKLGIVGQGLFMIGNLYLNEDSRLDGESYEQVLKTIEFAKKLRDNGMLDYVQFNIATPYPGSEMWDIVKKFDLFDINMEDWQSWGMDTHTVTFRHPKLSKEEITELHNKAWKEFAFNFHLFLRHLLRVRRFSDFLGLIRNIMIVLRVVLTGHPRKRYKKP